MSPNKVEILIAYSNVEVGKFYKDTSGNVFFVTEITYPDVTDPSKSDETRYCLVDLSNGYMEVGFADLEELESEINNRKDFTEVTCRFCITPGS